MAPSRKKGGGKAAASVRRQWKVGDLVLAKVKGFPAWPATVSEPEKWGYAADWKKVLVHFFGTQQIAFCNPVDVESFTEEKKQSLLTKRHAKGSDFVRAIKEITESYEKLKQQDQASDPKSAEEITVGSSRNTVELPQACENLIGTRLDTRYETTLLSEDDLAAEQMLALRHHCIDSNGACDSAVAKDLCEIAAYSSRGRNERGRSQKCVPLQRSKMSSRLEVDRLQSSMLQCNDGSGSVDGICDGAIRRIKRIRRPGYSESDDVVLSAPNLHGSDEENASEIATVESDSNSRNEGNRVVSGSKAEHSDAISGGFQGGHELNKGLDFQINTMAKAKKRKPTRKRETSDLIDPPAKVEIVSGLVAKASDSRQRSQNSHERLNERPCEKNGDEHLPLAKRARVRMSRAFYADENVNASSQFEERSSKDTLVSAPEQTSAPVNRENGIVSGRDTSAAEEINSFDLSAKLSGYMVDVVPSHTEKPSDRMSPSRACVHTVGDKENAIEFHENKCSMRSVDEVTRAQSNQLSSSPEGKAHVLELVQRCSEESQTRNCLNSESNPVDVQCSRQSEKYGTFLNLDTLDSSADKAPGLDTKASWIPAQSAHQHQSQENDSCDHSLITVGSCEAVEQKEQIQATNSISVSENLSREKLSLSPANVADSPARGSSHNNSVCHVSTAESAKVMQNGNCSTSVEFGQKKSMSDDTVKEETKVEKGATQVKKVVSSDMQFTIESFETALGSLVRTKETIGRATRLAMDLVKFGASAKAMEILAHTLESESNLQRRVDLFFLVDSIAQCSKGLNGDAGGVYLSSIQVMLPRLLAAAVPAGATTQENRRQCVKVLRLWLERRILPESIIRHHIRELDSHSNNNNNVPACLYSRRSARTERALDDPVRDMDGMLVDEYGSNSTLQLTGFSVPRMLKDKDDDDDSGSDDSDGGGGGGFESVTPEHESRKILTPCVTERHTRILEDVNGELEMEDVAPPFATIITDRADDNNNNPRMMNPPMHYRSPESSSYCSRASKSSSNFHQQHHSSRPYHYSSRREGSSSYYPHRSSSSLSHYTPEFDERHYYHHHERMRPDNWRYHHHHPPRYHDRYTKGPYNGHHHHHHRDSGRYQNQRWSHSPRGYNNNRHSSFHYKPHSETGPVPVGMRDHGLWNQR